MPTNKFTDGWIRHLSKQPLPAKEEEWYDAPRYPGLMIRRSPKGVLTLVSHGTVHGSGRRFKDKIGRYPSFSLAEAYEVVRGHSKLLQAGIHPADHERAEQLRAQQEASLTLSHVIDQYVERHCKHNNRSWKEQRQILRNVLCRDWGWGDRAIRSLERREINEKLHGMVGTNGERGQRAARVQATASKMFKWASSDAGYISVSPMYGMSRVRPPNPARNRWLSDAEIRALWSATARMKATTAAGTELMHPLAAMIRLGLLTGQRMGTGYAQPGEIRGMRWDEIDLKAGVWTIPSGRVKNKMEHKVPLCKDALQLLMQIRQPGEFVFFLSSPDRPYNNQHRDIAWVRKLMREELEETGGEYVAWRLHDLRRTVKTNLAALKVDWEVRARVQNHMSAIDKMDRAYNKHDYMDEKRDALKKWEQRLREIITGAAVDFGAPAESMA